MRLISQSADGLVQAALVASLAFSPERATTAAGSRRFGDRDRAVSLLGPFTGVFIDRWSRRRILVLAPWLRAARLPVLSSPTRRRVRYFAGAFVRA